MKNQILHALATFVASNYEQLKNDYNTNFTAKQKAEMPITIFMIGTFDTLLSNQQQENEKSNNIIEVVDAHTPMDNNI
jgi:hypothetical protein